MTQTQPESAADYFRRQNDAESVQAASKPDWEDERQRCLARWIIRTNGHDKYRAWAYIKGLRSRDRPPPITDLVNSPEFLKIMREEFEKIETPGRPQPSVKQPDLWAEIDAIIANMPASERDKLPADFSENLDKYLYGDAGEHKRF